MAILDNFTSKVEQSRKSGKTDTEILDFLSTKDASVGQKIKSSRGLYGQGKGIENDRDLVNFLSQKFGTGMPVTPSVPLKEEKPTSQVPKVLQPTTGIFGVAEGAGKGVISTIKGMSSLGEKGLRAGLKAVLPEKFEGTFGVAGKQEKTAAQELIPEALTTPVTSAQKAGFIGEQIAEFFIPGNAPTKAAKATEAIAKGGKFIKGAVSAGTKVLGEAGLAFGQTALQKGEAGSEAKTAGIIGAFTPPAVKVAGTVIKGLGRGAAEILGKTTGTGSEVITEAFKNPAVAGFMRKAGKTIGDFQNDVLGQVRTGLNALKQSRATQYLSRLSKIKVNNTQLSGITDSIRDKAVGLMDNFDISVTPQIDKLGNKLNQLDFSKSTLIEGANVVERALNDVMSWTDNTAIGFDKLKQRLGTYADQLSAPGKDRARSVVLQLKDSVKDGLIKNVPGYEEMTAGYHHASDLIDATTQALSLKNEKVRETAIKKIFGALRQNNEQRKEFLKYLGQASGVDLIAKVAGSQLSPLAPRGLAGTIFPAAVTGGGLSTILNPTAWPALFTYIAASSPRLVGELTNIAGRITDQMVKAGKFSPEIERAIRELFLKTKE